LLVNEFQERFRGLIARCDDWAYTVSAFVLNVMVFEKYTIRSRLRR
jgi:hypothetical protein